MRETVAIPEKYMLSIEEASEYFHIGENKLRQIADEHRGAKWTFYNWETPVNQAETV